MVFTDSKHRNRVHARNSRLRKKNLILNLQKKNKELDAVHQDILQQNVYLRKQNKDLLSRLIRIRDKVVKKPKTLHDINPMVFSSNPKKIDDNIYSFVNSTSEFYKNIVHDQTELTRRWALHHDANGDFFKAYKVTMSFQKLMDHDDIHDLRFTTFDSEPSLSYPLDSTDIEYTNKSIFHSNNLYESC